ncbi:AB-hydrolase YheT [Dacryopinax primogenitus]|uniref:AB-hydrolase YheT n=1 Tax=Dacryopinax primogenitus (strain DJM 731) TaxID=1858805 RepID=M5FN08_DACPD|nr:AB-hydrolase YheT [Dacryopinax primogenitus]EJT96620.1 AB-hydrolase YheT [Dacryopinax primogenitus]
MGAFFSLLSSLFAISGPARLWVPTTPTEFDILASSSTAANGTVPNGADKEKDIIEGTERTEKLSIAAFVKQAVPSLFEPFKPTWFLIGGHLQTAYCVVGDFTKVNQVHYTRKILTVPEGGSIAIDVAGSPSLPPTTPILVVCHGLAGGSHESYVRDVLSVVTRPKEEGGWGWRGVVCNFRGCGGSKLTSSQLYSAGYTNDLRTALLYLSVRFPGAPMVGSGFSLGACVLTRYLGEEGERSRLKAGMTLGCPWDLYKNSQRLEGNWFYRNTYSKAMGTNLRLVIKPHLSEILAHPLGQSIKPDIDALYRIRSPSLKTVDTFVTRHLGGPSPPFPFPSADAYYKWASCHRSLSSIRVPYLGVNADDDPIIMGHKLPLEETQASSWCALAVTRGGGHLGWFTGGGSPPKRWIRTPILQFVRAAMEDYVPPSGRSTFGWGKKDGWVYQVDDAGLRGEVVIGYREEEGEEGIEGAEELAGGKLAGL